MDAAHACSASSAATTPPIRRPRLERPVRRSTTCSRWSAWTSSPTRRSSSHGRAAPAPRRGDRDRRAARLLFLDEPTAGFDPRGAAPAPPPRAPALGPRGHDDPAHHARPRRGRAARRPHPDPGRRHVSSRTGSADQLARQVAPRRRGALVARRRDVRALDGRRHPTSSATCSTSTATRSSDLEVRRAEPGGHLHRPSYWAEPATSRHRSRRRSGEPDAQRGPAGPAARLDGVRCRASRSPQDQLFYLFTGADGAGLSS